MVCRLASFAEPGIVELERPSRVDELPVVVAAAVQLPAVVVAWLVDSAASHALSSHSPTSVSRARVPGSASSPNPPVEPSPICSQHAGF